MNSLQWHTTIQVNLMSERSQKKRICIVILFIESSQQAELTYEVRRQKSQLSWVRAVTGDSRRPIVGVPVMFHSSIWVPGKQVHALCQNVFKPFLCICYTSIVSLGEKTKEGPGSRKRTHKEDWSGVKNEGGKPECPVQQATWKEFIKKEEVYPEYIKNSKKTNIPLKMGERGTFSYIQRLRGAL